MGVKILPNYTYEDYAQWKGQWELIDGIPYARSSHNFPDHQRIAGNLLTEVRFALKTAKSTYCTYQPTAYLISDHTVLQPDFLLVHKEITKKYLDFPPTIIAEVLSDATLLIDRYSKYAIYESQGIKYYLIVSPDKEEVEVYELLDGKYELTKCGKDFIHEFVFPECSARIDFKEIW